MAKDSDELIDLLREIFFTGSKNYAQVNVGYSNISYHPEEGIPSDEQLEDHLGSGPVLGAYQLLPNSTVRWICWDVDSTEGISKAQKYAEDISTFLEGVPHAIEFSGNKGFHVWVFLTEPVPARDAKAFGDMVRSSVGAPKVGSVHVEVFPKQEKLTDSNPYGNLIKVPLSEHPKSHERSRFVDRTNGWQEGPSVDPLEVLTQRVSWKDLSSIGGDLSPVEQLSALIAPFWVSGERHDLGLALAGYLASSGWREEDVEDLFESLYNRTDDEDLQNRLQGVRNTYSRLSEGKSVVGFSLLADLIPPTTFKSVLEVAQQAETSSATQAIDRIRLSKGANFNKLRSAANVALSYLQDQGKLLLDQGELMWLDNESHRITTHSSDDWLSLLYGKFGLNPSETFGRQMAEELYRSSLPIANQVKVHRRSFWNGTRLFVHLNGPEVYEIGPEGIQTRINGTQGILFRDVGDFGWEGLYDLLEAQESGKLSPVSPWDFLVNDVSFAPAEQAGASHEEQLELVKCWILSSFFRELMPTKPILMAIGPAGSGKTTFARRILKLLEGPNEDVLGLVVDKPDSLRSSLVQHRVIVLDNLEKSPAPWLSDVLNRIATGTAIEIRKLYTDNEVHRIRPDSDLICTAIDIPFSEESLFSRMLPVEMDSLLRPKPEHLLQTQLRDNFAGMWLGMLLELQKVVASLYANPTVRMPTQIRLADFANFVARLQGTEALDSEVALSGLRALSNRQRKVLGNSSPFIVALDLWIQQDPAEAANNHTVGEIYQILQALARKAQLEWRWKTPQGLSQHIKMLEDGLIKTFGMESVREYVPAKGREETKLSFRIEEITADADLMASILNGEFEEEL